MIIIIKGALDFISQLVIMNNLSIPNYKVSDIIKNLIIFQPNVFTDLRGNNFEIFNNNYTDIIKRELGVDLDFKLDTASYSRQDVIRAFHSDDINWKFIQCLYGSVYAVIISEDLKSKVCITINDTNRYQILIPPKCFNGYLCLSERCLYTYKWSSKYISPDNQITKKWNDPSLQVDWPINNPILSERDK